MNGVAPLYVLFFFGVSDGAALSAVVNVTCPRAAGVEAVRAVRVEVGRRGGGGRTAEGGACGKGHFGLLQFGSEHCFFSLGA